jgi:exodeoxyribonuclease VII small subunit
MTRPNNTQPDDSALSFEQAYETLGEIVDRLESGELSLDESIALYERGRRLIALCEGRLSAAELRISQLMGGADGGVRAEPLS